MIDINRFNLIIFNLVFFCELLLLFVYIEYIRMTNADGDAKNEKNKHIGELNNIKKYVVSSPDEETKSFEKKSIWRW